MATAVAFQAITKTFPGAAAPALDRISFVIEAGELITILGTSGCGKTTPDPAHQPADRAGQRPDSAGWQSHRQ